MRRRVDPAAEQPAQHAPEDGRGHVRAHHHIQARDRQHAGEVSGKTGGQGRHEQTLDESRRDQHMQIASGVGDDPSTRNHDAPGRHQRPDRKAISEITERQIGECDTEQHGRHRTRCPHRINGEIALDQRQHRLRYIDIGECRTHQREHHHLQAGVVGGRGRRRREHPSLCVTRSRQRLSA